MTENFLKTLLLLVAITTGFVAKASLPALNDSYPKASLPYTFNITKNLGAIDINGDNTTDFFVEFSSNSGDNLCTIEGAYYESSGRNLILTEGSKKKSPGSLQGALPGYMSLLTSGESIGEDSWLWRAEATIMGEMPDFDSPLQASFGTGAHSGYAGVQFYIGGQIHYGWLNVQIDPSEQFVTINSAGYQVSAGLPAVAGLNDPFAVPVPIIASLLGIAAIGGGIFLKRRKKKVC